MVQLPGLPVKQGAETALITRFNSGNASRHGGKVTAVRFAAEIKNFPDTERLVGKW